jgi:hypothetical protein
MFDVLVRMIDQQGKEVLPWSSWLPAQRPAEEHRPLGGGARCPSQRRSLSACSCGCRATVRRGAFSNGSTTAKNSRAEPGACAPGERGERPSHVNEVQKLTAALRERPSASRSRAGSGRNSSGMLESLPLVS